jgi:hypothetical protein
LAENLFADDGSVLQNECRLAKRKRALQECNSPRNNQPESHRDDEPGNGGFVVPCVLTRFARLFQARDASPFAVCLSLFRTVPENKVDQKLKLIYTVIKLTRFGIEQI